MSSRKVTLEPSHLRLGMFVADLDRSWEGTPFIMQGLLVTDPTQINYLRQACREVIIDIDRSSADSVEHLPASGMKQRICRGGTESARLGVAEWLAHWWDMLTASAFERRGGERPDAPRKAESSLSPAHRTYGGRKVSQPGLGQRLALWWHGAIAALLGRWRGKRSRIARLAGIPKNVKLVAYSDTKSFEEAIGPAREAYRSIETTMKTVIGDLAENREIAVDALGIAVTEVVESIADNPEAMMWLTRMHEQSVRMYKHSVEVAIYMVAFGRHLGFPPSELKKLCMIGLLLDIGMTRIDNALLEKDGPLSDDEQAEMRRHVDYGIEMLRNVPNLALDVRMAIGQHHERIDGSGYPLGLNGEAMSFFGRMVAIADTFATLTSNRDEAETLSPFKSMRVLTEGAGTIFHETLVEQFVHAIGLFPVGSLVELSSGEVAAVVSHNKIRRLKPRVLVLTDPDKRHLDKPFKRNLLAADGDDSEALWIRRGLPAGAYGIDGRDHFLN